MIALVLILTLSVLAGGCNRIFFTKEAYNMTVVMKERVNKSESSYYLVHFEDPNGKTYVYKNVDSMVWGKWNSSDVQGALKVDSMYTLKISGIRSGPFSWYPNIVEYELQSRGP